MKIFLVIPLFFMFLGFGFAQTKPKQKEKPPTQADINKLMDEATKGMSPEEKAELQKMMNTVMPTMEKKPGSNVVHFTNNKKMVPAKDINRIKSIPKNIITEADVSTYTDLLFNKLIAKIPASEKTIITNVKAKDGATLMEASITSFMQGHNLAAMALSMKAIKADPKNVIFQNNLAAILSQSGYPEKAIPYLKKLSIRFPDNGTVLHNLAYAWFNLGEIDTARKLFTYAAARNPKNPETKLCQGVIEELRGDPKKAADNYVESFEDAPNPFTEKMTENVKAESRLENIDFEKLKKRIAIYEYFKKDWIPFPVLTDDVSAYERNKSIKNGYEKLFSELDARIESMVEASNAEIEALVDKGETAFAEAMMKESAKGLSMMSMPAVYVQKILASHIAKWTKKYTEEHFKLMENIKAQKLKMTTMGENEKCPDFDRKNNEFLVYANPLIRKFHLNKIEEARVWLNAFCTWVWYIAGNPKNSMMTQCIAWTSYIVDMNKHAIEDQFIIEKSCVNQNGNGVTDIPMPLIPNFTCPAVVSIPIGLDELRLSSDAINFDNNYWNIKQADGATIPNVTLSFGIDKNDILEPGKYGNPYAKTGNGSMATSNIGNDDELTPLKKILDELTPLSKIPPEQGPLNHSTSDANKKLSISDYKKARNAEITRKILNEMMKSNCNGELKPKKTRKSKFEVDIGTLVLENYWDEKEGAWINSKGEKIKNLELGVGEVELEGIWDEEAKAFIKENGDLVYKDGFTVGVGKVEWEEVKTSGLQTVINNGLEAVETSINFIKRLFD